MTTYVPPKNAAGYILYTGLVDQSDTKKLKSSPTLATGDFKVSIDGGAFANLSTTPTNTPSSSTSVKITLSGAEMTGDNIQIACIDAAGAEWCDQFINIQTAARQVDDLAYPATSGRSMVVDASGLVDANMVKAGPTGSGTAQTAGDIIGDTNDIQTRLPAALDSNGFMKSGLQAINTDTTAANNLAKTTKVILRGTVQTSGTTTTTIATSAFDVAGIATDQFKGRIVTFDANTTTTALRGQSTDITGSSISGTPILTVTALTTSPAVGDTFSVT